MWGIDRLLTSQLSNVCSRLRQSNVGVLTHAAAANSAGHSLLDVLGQLDIVPKVLFSPEHGLDGVAQAEESVPTRPEGSDADSTATGPALRSLYGGDKDSLTPRQEDLAELDVLLIDLVDVGSRYYTYVWTALLAARAAATKGIHTIVLDRPNPLSADPAKAEGKEQQAAYRSFVGLESIPIRHGLTLAELLCRYLNLDGQELGPSGALSVISPVGWERKHTASAWRRPFIPPSPNMPTLETALLYPGGCLVEGTNLSEGRGTAFPFRVIGAPFLDAKQLANALSRAELAGLLCRPISFKPSFEKHAGKTCHGVMLHVTDSNVFQPVASYLTLIGLAHAQTPQDFKFLDRPYEFETELPAFDLLTGSSETREAINDGVNLKEIVAQLTPVSGQWRDAMRHAEELAANAHA